MTLSNLQLGLFYGFIGVLIFATTLPVTAIGLEDFSPLVMSLGRALLAAIPACAVVLVFWSKRPNQRQIYRLAGIAMGIVFGFPLFATLAMQTVPATHGGVVLGLLPLCTALCGAWLLGERPKLWFWFWALAGAFFVVWFAVWDTGFQLEGGDAWLVAAILAASFGYTVGGGLSRDMPGWLVVSWVLVLSAPLIALIFFIFPPAELRPEVLSTIHLKSWIALFWVAFMSQFIGFFFWNAGLAKGGVAAVGQVQLLQIFFTLGFAALLVGETVSWTTLFFAIAVFACVMMGRRAL